MGKGYNNFMSKKAFHPGSYANQRKIHEAEADAEAKRKRDQETLAQYLKEQELFNQRSLVSKESKDKLSLNFMYETPAGIRKDKATELTSPSGSKPIQTDIKLEWNRDRSSKKQK